MSKSHNVKVTEEAHWLLAEMAEDCDTTMRELASEAITRMANRTREKKKFAYSAFFLGTIAGGALMFFIGVMV